MEDSINYLPTITKEVVDKVVKEFLKNPKYIDDIAKEIRDKDSALAEFIAEMAEKSKDPKSVLASMTLAWKLLYRQAEEDYKSQPYH